MFTLRCLPVLLWVGVLISTVVGDPLLNVTFIPVSQRTYNIKENFCRLLSHTSMYNLDVLLVLMSMSNRVSNVYQVA